MTDDKQTLIRAWLDAEQARREAVDSYMAFAWDGQELPTPQRVLTPHALEELNELRAAEEAARLAYYRSL
jgi:hypothetical protein